MKRFVRDNSLSLFFLALFVLALLGQSIAGYNVYNQEQLEHDEPTISYLRFLVSSDFGANVLENWQSEWLQFWLFALATVWFVQKGSNESKKPEDLGLETDEQQRVGAHAPKDAPRWARARDWRLTVYSYSFTIVMGAIFLATWLGQSFASLVYLQRRAGRARGARVLVGDLRHLVGLLGAKPPELAVGVSRRRDDGRLHDLPPPARIGGVEARRRAARGDGQLGLGRRLGRLQVRSSAARRSFARFAAVRSTPGWSVERQRPSAS